MFRRTTLRLKLFLGSFDPSGSAVRLTAAAGALGLAAATAPAQHGHAAPAHHPAPVHSAPVHSAPVHHPVPATNHTPQHTPVQHHPAPGTHPPQQTHIPKPTPLNGHQTHTPSSPPWKQSHPNTHPNLSGGGTKIPSKPNGGGNTHPKPPVPHPHPKPPVPNPNTKPKPTVVVVVPGGRLGGLKPLPVRPVYPQPLITPTYLPGGSSFVQTVGGTEVVESVPVVSGTPVTVIPPGVTEGQADAAGGTTALRLTEVTRRGPADRAGLRADDIIVKVNGKRIRNHDDLAAVKAAATDGKLRVEFYTPADNKLDVTDLEMAGGSVGITSVRTAVDLEDDADDQADPAATANAAQVSELTARGPAAKAGIRQGDVILAVGGYRVNGPDALAAVMAAAGAEVEVLAVNSADGKPTTRTVRPANGDLGLTLRPVRVDEK